MAIAVIISGSGALNGWTMICAEMPLAADDDGLFPPQFKKMSRTGVPAYGIIASTVLASIAMAINYWAPFFLAGGALLLGIPVYLAQRRHLSQPPPVPAYW